jgi:uncharacterized protein YegL
VASESNLVKAHSFIAGLKANGGTDIHKALTEALALIASVKYMEDSFCGTGISSGENKLPSNVESVIMFLTDGEPTNGVTNTEQILKEVRSKNTESSVPIYSVGFGTGVDFDFLKKLSHQNRAFSRKVYEAGDADIQMRGFYREISSPLLTNVRFQYTSDNFTVSKLTSLKFPNLFDGSEIAVAGSLKQKPGGLGKTKEYQVDFPIIAVNVDARGRNGDVTFRNETIQTAESSAEDYFMERLWAYITIKQLLETDNDTDEYVYEDEEEISASTQAPDFVEEEDTLPLQIQSSNSTQGQKEAPKVRALRLALKVRW